LNSGLHLEPLHQPFLCRYFWGRVSRTICPGWIQTAILLTYASWLGRITVWATGTRRILHQFLKCPLICQLNNQRAKYIAYGETFLSLSSQLCNLKQVTFLPKLQHLHL
jgi:hypothetical protein